MSHLLQLALFGLLCLGDASAPVAAMQDTQQQPRRRSDDEVRKDILAKLAAEPQLEGLAISVKVDSKRAVLSGRVHTTAQRDLAISIARNYADGRQVIDDFEIIP
jgi:osmotically-inducible protein OsmY